MQDYLTYEFRKPENELGLSKVKPFLADVLQSGYASEFSSGALPGFGYSGTEYVLKINEPTVVADKVVPRHRFLLFHDESTITDIGKRVKEVFGNTQTLSTLKGKRVTVLKQYDTLVGIRL